MTPRPIDPRNHHNTTWDETSTPATCKFCGTVASPNDEQNCSSLEEAYRQTPMRPHGCPWFEKDARKANPAPLPSAAENTNSGALPEWRMTYNNIKAAFTKHRKTLTVMDKPANFDSFSQGYVAGWNAKESAPQETRGDEITATITECINVKVLLTNIGGRSDDWIRGFDAGTNAYIDALEKLRTLATTLRGAGASMIDGLSPSDLANWTDNSNCNAGIALAAPQQSPRLEREGIAREVDPHAFKSWQGLYDHCIKDGETAEFAKRCADSFHGEAINSALIRADAILALLSPDTTVVSSTDPREVGK